MNIDGKKADVWVVAGAPGSGKSTVSKLLLKSLNPPPALLDKDIMYGSFVSSILAEANKPEGEREGVWYDKNIKVHEYSGMADTAREIRSNDCPVLLSGPLTSQIHDASNWQEWVERLGGASVHLVWVQTDKETLRARLERRNSERDARKLKNFDEFIGYMQLDSSPPVEHIAIDNRDSANDTLEKQIERIVAQFKR